MPDRGGGRGGVQWGGKEGRGPGIRFHEVGPLGACRLQGCGHLLTRPTTLALMDGEAAVSTQPPAHTAIPVPISLVGDGAGDVSLAP